MDKLFANTGDPDQIPHLQLLIWVCTVCQLPFYGSPDYSGLKDHTMHMNLLCILNTHNIPFHGDIRIFNFWL